MKSEENLHENKYTWIQIMCFFLCILFLVGCSNKHTYTPELYTKTDVISMCENENELFNNLVSIIVHNDEFYEKRKDEYDDAFFCSPHDEELKWFDEEDSKTIAEFFEFKPYMISYDLGRRFVEVTFLSSEEAESYTLLFWIKNSNNDEIFKFQEYSNYLSYTYVVETLEFDFFSEYRILLYYNTGHYHNQISIR